MTEEGHTLTPRRQLLNYCCHASLPKPKWEDDLRSLGHAFPTLFIDDPKEWLDVTEYFQAPHTNLKSPSESAFTAKTLLSLPYLDH
mmetsp:Transcript_19460/g.28749  ORF Transcript_19460/g.28749 Transcript_19460/m.28749 type:complete len:86 (+) Transcript_19460:108-365(+)